MVKRMNRMRVMMMVVMIILMMILVVMVMRIMLMMMLMVITATAGSHLQFVFARVDQIAISSAGQEMRRRFICFRL